MSLIAVHLTPWMFEMALVAPLPDIFFSTFWMLINLLGGCFIPWGDVACQGVRSPGQCDLAIGRKTMAEQHLAEFIAVCIQCLKCPSSILINTHLNYLTSQLLFNLDVHRLVHGIKLTHPYVQQCLLPLNLWKPAYQRTAV
jgi:hypothetical protein